MVKFLCLLLLPIPLLVPIQQQLLQVQEGRVPDLGGDGLVVVFLALAFQPQLPFLVLVKSEPGRGEQGEVELGLGGGLVYSAKSSKGPATFVEMGFQGAKAEDKERVVK